MRSRVRHLLWSVLSSEEHTSELQSHALPIYTLLKKVLEKMGVVGLDDALKGATSVMVGPADDPISPAREIENFHKENPDFLVAKSLYLDGAVRPGSDVVELSKIPDRQGMLAQLVAIILGPGSTIAGQLKSLTEKLEKEQAGASA